MNASRLEKPKLFSCCRLLALGVLASLFLLSSAGIAQESVSNHAQRNSRQIALLTAEAMRFCEPYTRKMVTKLVSSVAAMSALKGHEELNPESRVGELLAAEAMEGINELIGCSVLSVHYDLEAGRGDF